MLANLRRRSWCLILPALLLFPGMAAAAEFSAQMWIKEGDKTMPAKVFVQNGKIRQEFNDAGGRTVTIVRPDKKLFWVVMPQDKSFIEMPLKNKLPGQFIEMPPDAISKRQVGTETVNGYEADKYEVTVRGGPEGVTRQTVWVAKKLGAPIKMVCPSQNLCVEYKGIKEGGMSALLFEPPKGFTKTSSPIGFSSSMRQEIE